MLVCMIKHFVFCFSDCTEDFKFKVKTVTAGQNVTLTCPRQTATLYHETLYWIRLVSGNWPEFLGATFNFEFEEVSKIPYIETKQDQGEFLLHINEAQQNDTGLYYCIKVRQLDFIFMNGTFLKIKGNISVNSFFFSGDKSDALQCSVLSNSERSTCPADNKVYWFKAGSDDSHPNLLYLQGNSLDECEKISDAPSIQKCFYNFSETVDPGTYYCAVAACGQILFGNGENHRNMRISSLTPAVNGFDKPSNFWTSTMTVPRPFVTPRPMVCNTFSASVPSFQFFAFS
uniref:Ig-like domain-containing protein n=1 Tax=Cyprinodon variegatus TaxID=28743 RepID=A0A3Q2DVA4_CYPVA